MMTDIIELAKQAGFEIVDGMIDLGEHSDYSATEALKAFTNLIRQDERNQLAECQKDADRYRYLKTDTNMQFNVYQRLEIDEIDAAIDEMIAMSEKW